MYGFLSHSYVFHRQTWTGWFSSYSSKIGLRRFLQLLPTQPPMLFFRLSPDVFNLFMIYCDVWGRMDPTLNIKVQNIKLEKHQNTTWVYLIGTMEDTLTRILSLTSLAIHQPGHLAFRALLPIIENADQSPPRRLQCLIQMVKLS
jgi:hypothetical protein